MKHNAYLLIFLLLSTAACSDDVTKCNKDADCLADNYCTEAKTCRHSEKIELDLKKIVFLVIMALLCITANTTSIQGGSIVLPIYILVFNFSVVESLAIIKCLNMIGNTIYFFLNIKERRPGEMIFLTDYNFVFMFMPVVLIGAFYGVSIAIALPAWVLMLICMVLISVSIYKNVLKANAKMKEEDAAEQAPQKDQGESTSAKSSPRPLEEDEERILPDGETHSQLEIKQQITEQGIDEIKGKFPFLKFFYTIGVAVTLSVIKFAAGSKEKPSIFGIDTCSGNYWLLFFSVIPIAGTFCLVAYYFVRKEQDVLDKYGYKYTQHDKKWDNSKMMFTSSAMLAVALISSGVGVGGGLLIMPLMMEIGFDILGAGNTNNCIQMLREGSQALYFYVEGKVIIPWVLLFSINSILGPVFGTMLRKYCMRKNKISWVMWTMTGVLSLATVLIGLVSYLKLKKKIDQGENIFAFHSLC